MSQAWCCAGVFQCIHPLGAQRSPTERIELSDLVQRLAVDTSEPSTKWGEIPSKLGVRWLDSATSAAPPAGMDSASVSKHMAVPIKIGGQPARYSIPAGSARFKAGTLVLRYSRADRARALCAADSARWPATHRRRRRSERSRSGIGPSHG